MSKMHGRFPPGPPPPPPPGSGAFGQPPHARPPGPNNGPPFAQPHGPRPTPKPKPKPDLNATKRERKGRSLVSQDAHKANTRSQKQFASTPRRVHSKPKWKVRGYILLSLLGLTIAGAAIFFIPYAKGLAQQIVGEKERIEKERQRTEFAGFVPDNPKLDDSMEEIRDAALRNLNAVGVTVDELVDRYSRVSQLKTVRTLSFGGMLNNGIQNSEVKYFVRAPNQIRRVEHRGAQKTTTVVDGLTGREEITSPQSNSTRSLTPVECLTFILTSTPPLTIWQYDANRDQLVDRGHEDIEVAPNTQVLTNLAFPGTEIQHHFNRFTSLEIKRVAIIETDGSPVTLEINFEDFEKSGEYVVPSQITVRNSQNEEPTRITINDWSFNPGLLPSLFTVE